MRIDVWSDIACPWCWLGKHHLQEALKRAGVADAEVAFRSFELQPGAERKARPVREYLMERYGSPAQIDAAHARLVDAGKQVGIHYDFDRALMVNTFDAHRLHHLAMAQGKGEAVMERLMRARQGEGADISDHATLRALAVEAGLDAADVDRVLSSDEYADAVRADEAMARQIGVGGVPFFVFEGKYAVSGAHPVETFEQVLRRVAAER